MSVFCSNKVNRVEKPCDFYILSKYFNLSFVAIKSEINVIPNFQKGRNLCAFYIHILYILSFVKKLSVQN